MPMVDNAWYIHFGNGSSTGWWAVTPWAATTAVAAGAIRRQLAAPSVGNERCFVCVVAGTTLGSEPAWTLTRGALTAEAAGPTWQECTGIAALNGDATDTPAWTSIKNTAIVLGQVIKRDNGASYQICTVAGTAGNGSEPAFSNTAGTTTADNTVTWTSLGVVGNFAIWNAPHARQANAYAATWGQAGNSFYNCEASETQASLMTLTQPGTAVLPSRTLSVRAASSSPPVSADLSAAGVGTITTTGNFAMNLGGYGSWEGFTFSAGSGAVAAALGLAGVAGLNKLKNCTLKKAGTSGSAGAHSIGVTTAATYYDVILEKVNFQFGAASDGISIKNSGFYWYGGGIAGSTFPTTLFQASQNIATYALIEGVDLSPLTGVIVGAQSSAAKFLFRNCKKHASATWSATQTVPGVQVDVVNCASDSKNYIRERHNMMGDLTTETTIVRTGNGTDGRAGASDGVTPHSWKIVTTANSQPYCPFETPRIQKKNSVTGSAITITAECVCDAAAVPNNTDIYLEVEGLGTASFTQSIFYNDGPADVLAAGATQDASTLAWTTTGLATPQKFKLVVTFTPTIAGEITARVKVPKKSFTVYIDPKLTIS